MSFVNKVFRRKDEEITSGPLDEEPRDQPPKEREPIRLSPRQQVLLVFVATLLLGVLCAAGSVITFRPARPVESQDAEVVLDYAVQTAREAYVPAVEVIRAEDPGAVLASAGGVWNPVIDQVYLKAGRTGWTFHFYLPATRQMAAVVVDRGGQALIDSVQPWETPPVLLDDMRWQADSPIALQAFNQACSETLSGTPDARVEARLSTASSNMTLMWSVKLISVEDPLAVCQVNVDAVTGLVR